MSRPSSDEEDAPDAWGLGNTVTPVPDETRFAFRHRIREIPPDHVLGPRLSLIRDDSGAHPMQRRRLPTAPPPSLPAVTPDSPPDFQILQPQVFPHSEPTRFYAYTGPPIPRRSDMGPRVRLATDHTEERTEEGSLENVSTQKDEASGQEETCRQNQDSLDLEEVSSDQSAASSRKDFAETKK